MSKLKQKKILAPQSQKQAEEFLKQLASKQRRVLEIENMVNDEIIDIKQKYEQRAQPINNEIDALFSGLQAWAESNRNALCAKGKSFTIATGTIGWRKNPPSVRLSKIEAVLENLKRFKLTRFIRVKETVDKEAILADKKAVEGVAGISINDGNELFFVEPFETEIEKAKAVKK